MEAIWKQPLEVANKQTILMPIGAKILCVQTQHEKPCIWFVTPETKDPALEMRVFIMYGTGHESPQIDGRYIGTFQLRNGVLVFHVFESEEAPRIKEKNTISNGLSMPCSGCGKIIYPMEPPVYCYECNRKNRM